jgi:hypothetical protein
MLADGGEPYDLTMDLVRGCPEARLALGGQITWALGLSSGGCQRDTYGSVHRSLKIKGDRQRGVLRFGAALTDGVWVIKSAVLRVEGQRPVDLLTCARSGRR